MKRVGGWWRIGAWLGLFLLAVTMPVEAFQLVTNRNLNSGANLVGESFPGLAETIVRVGGLYQWANRDGAGTPASANLLFGPHQIVTDNGTSLIFNLNGGEIQGDSGVTAVLTARTGDESGSVSLRNAVAVAMGRIDTRGGGNWKRAGAVNLGEAPGVGAGPLGSIRVDGIWTHVPPSTSYAYGGHVTIYGSGNVKIETATETAGNILTYGIEHWGATGEAGSVLIRHAGSFRAGTVQTSTGNSGNGGFLTLDGALTGGAPSGTCLIGAINTRFHRTTSDAYSGGNVGISNYTGVTIGTLNTSSTSTGAGKGGTVRIRNIAGDVVISTAPDLRSANAANHGDLEIGTTSGGMGILAGLRFSQVNNVTVGVDRGYEAAVIQNELTGFDTSWTNGFGTYTHPYVTTQTRLRVSSKQQIQYSHVPGVLNDYLGGHVYRVADLEGRAGEGGLLIATFKPPPRGTVVIFR